MKPLLLLAPGFSRVSRMLSLLQPFQRLQVVAAQKPLKRLMGPKFICTGLKPGANESRNTRAPIRT